MCIMESQSNLACTETGVIDQTMPCGADLVSVLASSCDVNCKSVTTFQGVENHIRDSMEIIQGNGAVADKKYFNEVLSDSEDTGLELFKGDSVKSAAPQEAQAPVKTLSPTIFENAVKVVKNLFSPAKAHGIFSLGLSQDNKQSDIKKISNGEIKTLNGGTSCKTEQLPLVERNVSFSLSSWESNLCSNEDNMFNVVTKNFLNSTDTHNNTNDSYTSTVSLMDESFQSTVTHFDDCVQNEVENSKTVTYVESNSVFENSLNDTIGADDQSLNYTLKRNVSISSGENGELNATFETLKFAIPAHEKFETADEMNVREGSSGASRTEEDKVIGTVEDNCSKEIKEGPELIIETGTSREVEKTIQPVCEGTVTEILSTSTPNKPPLENTTCASFVDIFSDKLYQPTQKTMEIGGESDTYSCTNLDAGTANDDQSVGRLSATNRSSETDCSIFSGKSDNLPSEKITPLKFCTDLEKNFSTSTIIISKNELDSMNFSSPKEARVPKPQSSPEENESLIYDDADSENLTVTGTKGTGVRKMTLCVNNVQLIEENVDHSNNCKKNSSVVVGEGEVEKKESASAHSLTSKSLDELSPETNALCSPAVEEATIDSCNRETESFNFIGSNIFPSDGLQMKSEECGIPLASQKSYTVLHNLNPNLNRPVVSDSTCDAQADKLNDIILGNRPFSDLNVVYDEKTHSDEAIIPSGENYLNTPTHSHVNSDRMSTDTNRTSNSDAADLKILNLEESMNVANSSEYGSIPDNDTEMLVHVKDNSEFDGSSSTESRKITSMEPEKQTIKCFEQKETLSSLNISEQNLMSSCEIACEDNISEKTPKNESPVIKTFDRSIITDITEANVSFSEGKKKQDIINRKKDLELELSPLIKGTPNGEVVVGSSEGVINSFLCIGGNSLSNDNLGVVVEKMDVIDDCNRKDFYVNEEVRDFNSVTNSRNNGSESENSVEAQSKTNIKNALENVISDFERLKMNDSVNEESKKFNSDVSDDSFCTTAKLSESVIKGDEPVLCENATINVKALSSDTELTQLIKEQFTETDIEKICSVVDDIPELNLSKNIVIASQQFDRSFQGKILNESENIAKVNNFVIKDDNDLDFLDSIKGKPSSRDYSRESLYIKFDPLVQTKTSTTLLDIREGDKENVIAPPITRNSNIGDTLIPITPLKQSININSVSPLTPTSQNNESKLSTEKLNKLRELQNEISRLREFYLQREEINKEKMNSYENEITKLTGKVCVLEDKLKESEEIENSLVKKLNAQNESMNRLKNVVEECMSYTSKLTDETEKSRRDGLKEISVLKEERDYYMNHLQSTEQAFSDVFNKYEKCKKAVDVYKKNEEAYKAYIDNLKERIEQYTEKIKEVQESAAKEVNRLREKMNDMKFNHSQEISKFKAQLRITELKVQTVQEALEQKIKENQELAGICDELIEGKECDR